MLLRIFGGLLIIAGFGLGGVSGYLAYIGFSDVIGLPFIGVIGPLVALSLVSLGVAIEVAFRRRKWAAFAPLLLLTAFAGFVDKTSGEIALKNIVNESTQGDSDRNQAFTIANSVKVDLETQIKNLEKEFEVMTGDDIEKAQDLLLSRGLYVDENGNPLPVDGDKGPDTRKAMADRGTAITAKLESLRSDLKKATDTVAAGASISEAPFTLHQAELYALMITIFSVLFAFAGSFVYEGFDTEPHIDEELDELEKVAETMENNIVKLADRFGVMADEKKPRKRG